MCSVVIMTDRSTDAQMQQPMLATHDVDLPDGSGACLGCYERNMRVLMAALCLIVAPAGCCVVFALYALQDGMAPDDVVNIAQWLILPPTAAFMALLATTPCLFWPDEHCTSVPRGCRCCERDGCCCAATRAACGFMRAPGHKCRRRPYFIDVLFAGAFVAWLGILAAMAVVINSVSLPPRAVS